MQARTELTIPAMNLDLHTLFLVTIYVEAILGLLLLFVWAQNWRFARSAGGALRICCGWPRLRCSECTGRSPI